MPRSVKQPVADDEDIVLVYERGTYKKRNKKGSPRPGRVVGEAPYCEVEDCAADVFIVKWPRGKNTECCSAAMTEHAAGVWEID